VARIAIVADDLTGAADTGAAFACAGLSTLVTWTNDGLVGEPQPAVDALAIDAGTRALDAAGAGARTARIVRAVRTAGVEAIYKKADSLLRGHIAVDTAAVLSSWHEGAVAVAAFAFPDAGRTTIHGRQCAPELPGGLPIGPLFARANLSTTGIDLEIVRGDALADAVPSAAARSKVMVFDALDNGDLARIVAAGRQLRAPVVWVGTGGLARALAASMRPEIEPPRTIDRVPRRGPVLIVSGSASRVAREQVARVAAAGATPVEVPAGMLRDAATAAGGMMRAIGESLDRNRDAGVFPAAPGESIDPEVARGLGHLVSTLADRVSGVALTGGDTATAVLRAWGITGLRIVDEIEPGVPLSISEGAHRIAVVTKAGAFGSPDVFVKARERLHMIVAIS
jgi:4-hydroxythreonine-4-phosphate dehydrogenase